MTGQALLFALIGAVVFLAAYQTQTGWLYLTAAAGLGVLLVGAWQAWWGLRGLTVHALPQAPAYQGGEATLMLSVRRDRRGVARGVQVLVPPKKPPVWFRFWRGQLVPDGWQARTILAVSSSEPASVSLALPTERRGEFPLPVIYLQSAYPLGLWAATRRVALPGRFLVYPVGPRVASLPWLAPVGEAQGLQRLVDERQGHLIRGVREYRPGDAWREIHWRTTARRGQPFVRESELEQGEALVLVLDLRAEVHTPETLEHLITVAASLVAHGEEHGRPVRLLTQSEAAPAGEAPPGFENLAWLARAQAVATSEPHGPAGAVLLSSAYVPGWGQWASHFVYCPGVAANALDATVYCPVGAEITEALGLERRP